MDGTSRTHDADGNLTNDGKTYVYDAENRLIEVKDTGGNTVEQYEYDYRSRRITRSVYGGATVQSFIYDGWNPIAMYNAGALSQTYTWGQDLSGSMQGAGGVGGLVEVSFNSNSYYPTYDGNGNVSEYLDSSGSVVAHFEYDAFGKTVVENGTLAGNFSHRFSTKQWNPLAELYYYGYRYYAPETGRWINRDPIEENGGLNLYGFVGNDCLNDWDRLGLQNGPQVKGPLHIGAGCGDSISDKLLSDPWVIKFTDYLSHKKCKVLVLCRCDSDGVRGGETRQGRGGWDARITFIDVSRPILVALSTIVHELSHASDYCDGRLENGSCDSHICSELRAYHYGQSAMGGSFVGGLTYEQRKDLVIGLAWNSAKVNRSCKKEGLSKEEFMQKATKMYESCVE